MTANTHAESIPGAKISPVPFLVIFFLPMTVVTGFYTGGWFTFSTVLWTFGIVPLLDVILGIDKKNPEGFEEADLVNNRTFRYITWACAPVQVALTFWAMGAVSHYALSWIEIAGLAVSLGITGGTMGINVSHELIHRDNRFERRLGKMMLWTVCYTHWAIEHVYGHHAHVATPKDPATSWLGESFYRFWPRTVIGTFKSAWEIELRRLARMKKPVWSIHNQILMGVVYEAALAAGIGVVFGPIALGVFLVQAVVAFSLLEVVNYLEHYGLVRREIADGKYERVTPIHSWNASNWMTNYFLFHLQRHSDHHAAPGRRYQILRHFDESPQLPTGYAGMVLLALVPPAWFKVMDPKVKRFRAMQDAYKAESEEDFAKTAQA